MNQVKKAKNYQEMTRIVTAKELTKGMNISSPKMSAIKSKQNLSRNLCMTPMRGKTIQDKLQLRTGSKSKLNILVSVSFLQSYMT